ncbi:MAG: ROK family protein [Planctomycetota bacterium]
MSGSTNRPFFVGVDVGGTNIKAGVCDSAGRALAQDSVPTESARGIDAGVANIAAVARAVVEEAGVSWDDVPAVGLVTPGPMDIPGGRLLETSNLPAWNNQPVRDLVATATGKPVAFENDANAAAYGEFWSGAGKDHDSLVYWTLGTGIGCGIILDDVVIRGAHSHGSECGHIIIDCNDKRRHPGTHQLGTLEAYAGARGLVNRCREKLAGGKPSSVRHALKTPGSELTPKLIAEHAAIGDPVCEEVVLETAEYMAVGCVTLMHTVDPEAILFGGAMTFGREEAPLGRLFLERVKTVIKQRAFPACADNTEIAFATLGGDAGFVGAAGIARRLSIAAA